MKTPADPPSQCAILLRFRLFLVEAIFQFPTEIIGLRNIPTGNPYGHHIFLNLEGQINTFQYRSHKFARRTKKFHFFLLYKIFVIILINLIIKNYNIWSKNMPLILLRRYLTNITWVTEQIWVLLKCKKWIEHRKMHFVTLYPGCCNTLPRFGVNVTKISSFEKNKRKNFKSIIRGSIFGHLIA